MDERLMVERSCALWNPTRFMSVRVIARDALYSCRPTILLCFILIGCCLLYLARKHGCIGTLRYSTDRLEEVCRASIPTENTTSTTLQHHPFVLCCSFTLTSLPSTSNMLRLATNLPVWRLVVNTSASCSSDLTFMSLSSPSSICSRTYPSCALK